MAIHLDLKKEGGRGGTELTDEFLDEMQKVYHFTYKVSFILDIPFDRAYQYPCAYI